MRLSGKSIVITGSGSGVGRAACLLFAREGATVIGLDIDAVFGEKTQSLIKKSGGRSEFHALDLGDATAIAAVSKKLVAKHGVLHGLFNNAATLVRGDFESLDYRDWQRQMAVDLDGPFLLARGLLPALKAAGSAAILNHGSIDGELGNPSCAAYSVAKGGLITLTHIMAHALAPHGIRVNCLNTGWINRSETGIPIRLTAELARGEVIPEGSGIQKATLLGRPCSVEECARAALPFFTDELSYLTGSSIMMDGGRTAMTPGTY